MELCDRNAVELATMLREGRTSSRALTESVLGRIAEREDTIHAYITVTGERALEQADRADRMLRDGGPVPPLTGIPVAVKDNMCTKGTRTTCASRILENYVPPYDATVVERLLQDGAVIVGKTNMDEFAMGSSTENSAFGPTRNPVDPRYVPGGSSGGSAAAVASGEAVLALGSDTGGSIRLPAAYCGTVGIKPTYGRVSRYGLVSYASSLDQIGALGRSVEDCALLLNTICGHDRRDSTSADVAVPDFSASLAGGIEGVRIGLPKEYFVQGLDDRVRDRIMEAVHLLKDNGARIVDISMPHCSYAISSYYLVATAEASSNLARYDGVKYGFRGTGDRDDCLRMYERTRTEGFGKEVKRRIMLGTYVLSAGYYDAYYLKAQKVRSLITSGLRKGLRKGGYRHDAGVALHPLQAWGENRRTSPDVPGRRVHRVAESIGSARHERHVWNRRRAAGGAPDHRQGLRRGRRAACGPRLRTAQRIEIEPGHRHAPCGTAGYPMEYEFIICFETHVELNTATKLFCDCSTTYGAPANTHVCPVCTGLPGALPVLNRRAVECCVLAGLSLNCAVNTRSRFARKNYFYPDLPKGYQISQYELPFCENGFMEIFGDDGRPYEVGIKRIHLEEDAGKLVHSSASFGDADYSLVDYNRSSIPLLEIVADHTRNPLRSIREARTYLEKLRQVLRYTEVSECSLEKGQFRCDVNVSLRPKGAKHFGNRAEVKNMSSFKSISDALEFEIKRQGEILDSGGHIPQETRLFDEAKRITIPMRSKEDAPDYRYFPDPDLLEIELDRALLDEIRGRMPELADTKLHRFIDNYGLSEQDAAILTKDKSLSEFFERAAAASPHIREIGRWITRDLFKVLHTAGVSLSDCPIEPEPFARLVNLVHDGGITGQTGARVLEEMCRTGADPESIVERDGLHAIHDNRALEQVIDRVLEEHREAVDEMREGNAGAVNFLIGQVMKKTGGKADPKQAGDLIRSRAQESD